MTNHKVHFASGFDEQERKPPKKMKRIYFSFPCRDLPSYDENISQNMQRIWFSFPCRNLPRYGENMGAENKGV